MRKLKSQIKAELLYYGIKFPPQFEKANWTREMTTWMEGLEWKYVTGHSSLQSKLRHLAFVRQEWLAINKDLRQYVTTCFNDDYQLLMTIPGVGPVIAIGIYQS